MQTMQEKIIQYAASTYSGNIANKLKNRTQVVLNAPDYSDHIMARHQAKVLMVQAQQANLLRAMNQKKEALVTAVVGDPTDTNTAIDLAKVDNDILQLEFEMGQEVEIHLTIKEKGSFVRRQKRTPIVSII